MKKSILRERRERYYEELRKIGLMDETKEDNTNVELENDNENEESTTEIENIDGMFKDGNPEYIEETNENETIQEEIPLKTSKKVAKTGKKKVVND